MTSLPGPTGSSLITDPVRITWPRRRCKPNSPRAWASQRRAAPGLPIAQGSVVLAATFSLILTQSPWNAGIGRKASDRSSPATNPACIPLRAINSAAQGGSHRSTIIMKLDHRENRFHGLHALLIGEGSGGRSAASRMASSPSTARLAKREQMSRAPERWQPVSKTRPKIGCRIPSCSWIARLVQPIL